MGLGKKWTQRELTYLVNNYQLYGAEYVAAQLGRTPQAVRQQAWRDGLTAAKGAHAAHIRRHTQRVGVLERENALLRQALYNAGVDPAKMTKEAE